VQAVEYKSLHEGTADLRFSWGVACKDSDVTGAADDRSMEQTPPLPAVQQGGLSRLTWRYADRHFVASAIRPILRRSTRHLPARRLWLRENNSSVSIAGDLSFNQPKTPGRLMFDYPTISCVLCGWKMLLTRLQAIEEWDGLGRRIAQTRLAHFRREISFRLKYCERSRAAHPKFALTQRDLAEYLDCPSKTSTAV
jgi:hypothetical protein